MFKRILLIIISLIILTLILYGYRNSTKELKTLPLEEVKKQTNMNIASTTFDHQAPIPSQYTCDGTDINPPLEFSQVPEGTETLALIVDDPDAPGQTWVHWVVFNITPDTKEIAENSVPAGAIEGMTDFGNTGYGGPCPPSGIHRYFFKLYALDTVLDLTEEATKQDLLGAMENHVIAETQLIGTYEKE